LVDVHRSIISQSTKNVGIVWGPYAITTNAHVVKLHRFYLEI